MNCLAPPLGCGREISESEFNGWDALSQVEFKMSQWCIWCQDDVFTEEDEDGDWESDPYFDWEKPF